MSALINKLDFLTEEIDPNKIPFEKK